MPRDLFEEMGVSVDQPRDLFSERGINVAKDLSNQAQQQSSLNDVTVSRKPQIQEQFSNPTQIPGFENLPKEQQLQQIKFSQFDPANLSAMGQFVPPGSYENPVTRMAASIVPTLAAPELRAGFPLLKGGVNALSRIGAGTAGNIAYEAPNINSMEELGKTAKQSAFLNSLLEGATAPLRISGQVAELFNPKKYANALSKQIRNEGLATKAVMEQEFKPVNDLYNDFTMTLTPEKYLKDSGVTRTKLFPDAKLQYDEFIKNPTYRNLHQLQSNIGKDWARISTNSTMENRAQAFSQMRQNLQDKIKGFLKRDPDALAQYNKANQYATNVHYPYLSTPTLKDIHAGITKTEPQKLKESLRIGTKKTVGKERRSLIPKEHPLRNHLLDLEKKISRGNVMQVAVPGILGGVAGEYAYPGFGGAIGGAAGGLGLGALGKLGAHLGGNTFTSMMQEPWFQELSGSISPLYYGVGRGIIAETGEKK